MQRRPELGLDEEAAARPTAGLRGPQCRDREVLQSTLHEISGSSDGLLEALESFAASPRGKPRPSLVGAHGVRAPSPCGAALQFMQTSLGRPRGSDFYRTITPL